jgi:hypothetical protein
MKKNNRSKYILIPLFKYFHAVYIISILLPFLNSAFLADTATSLPPVCGKKPDHTRSLTPGRKRLKPVGLLTWTAARALKLQVTCYTRGLRSCESPHVSKTRKTGNVKMPVDSLSDAPWEALICSLRGQNGWGESVKLRAQLAGLRGSFYCGRG